MNGRTGGTMWCWALAALAVLAAWSGPGQAVGDLFGAGTTTTVTCVVCAGTALGAVLTGGSWLWILTTPTGLAAASACGSACISALL